MLGHQRVHQTVPIAEPARGPPGSRYAAPPVAMVTCSGGLVMMSSADPQVKCCKVQTRTEAVETVDVKHLWGAGRVPAARPPQAPPERHLWAQQVALGGVPGGGPPRLTFIAHPLMDVPGQRF